MMFPALIPGYVILADSSALMPHVAPASEALGLPQWPC